MARTIFNVACLVVLLGTITLTQQPADPASGMAEAAARFLDTLNDEQEAAVRFPFDGEDRFDWHFIPRERKGVSLKMMTGSQRGAALDLVRTGLSEEGLHEVGDHPTARADPVRAGGPRHPRPRPLLLHDLR